jgi:hypothetical protein
MTEEMISQGNMWFNLRKDIGMDTQEILGDLQEMGLTREEIVTVLKESLGEYNLHYKVVATLWGFKL